MFALSFSSDSARLFLKLVIILQRNVKIPYNIMLIAIKNSDIYFYINVVLTVFKNRKTFSNFETLCTKKENFKSANKHTYCLLWSISTNGGGGLDGFFSPSMSNSMSSSSSFYKSMNHCQHHHCHLFL